NPCRKSTPSAPASQGRLAAEPRGVADCRAMANVIGQRVRRKEDPRFLRGEGRYVDNMPLEDALHLTLLRSPVAHARITGIDVSEARALPGVQVFTADDIELGSNP